MLLARHRRVVRLEDTNTIDGELFAEFMVGEELEVAEHAVDHSFGEPVGSDDEGISEIVEAITRMTVVIGWDDETHVELVAVFDPESPSSELHGIGKIIKAPHVT